MSRRKFYGGLVLGGLMLMVFGFSGCKTMRKVREKALKNGCVENLTRIDHAKAQWALDNKKDSGPGPGWEDLLGSTSSLNRMPKCPAGGTYTVNPIGTAPSCSVDGHVLD